MSACLTDTPGSDKLKKQIAIELIGALRSFMVIHNDNTYPVYLNRVAVTRNFAIDECNCLIGLLEFQGNRTLDPTTYNFVCTVINFLDNNQTTRPCDYEWLLHLTEQASCRVWNSLGPTRSYEIRLRPRKVRQCYYPILSWYTYYEETANNLKTIISQLPIWNIKESLDLYEAVGAFLDLDIPDSTSLDHWTHQFLVDVYCSVQALTPYSGGWFDVVRLTSLIQQLTTAMEDNILLTR